MAIVYFNNDTDYQLTVYINDSISYIVGGGSSSMLTISSGDSISLFNDTVPIWGATINGTSYSLSPSEPYPTISVRDQDELNVTAIVESTSESNPGYITLVIEGGKEYDLLAYMSKGGYTVKLSVATGLTVYYLLAGETEYRVFNGDATGVYYDTIDNVISVYGPTGTGVLLHATGNYTGSGTESDPWIPLEDGCIFGASYGQGQSL